MAGEWQEYPLGTLTDWSSGGTPSKGNPAYWNGSIPWISASSMKTGRLYESDRTITEAGLEHGSRLTPSGAVLLLVRGSELHKRIPIGIAMRPVAFNQDVKALLPRTGVESSFLYYWLSGNANLLLQKVEHTGIGAGKLDTRVMQALPVRLPLLSEQRAIAHILGTLDDKIELNRRMNETLEAMARALFKSWFVDFDPVRSKTEGRDHGLPKPLAALFPDSFESTDLGQIPKGWKTGTLADFVSLNPESWSKDTRPSFINYVDLSNTKWGRIESIATYARQDAPSRAQRVLRPGDTIIGTVRPGNCSYALINNDGLTGSTGFAVLRPRQPEYAPFVYLAVTAPKNIEALQHLADGGAYPAVQPEIVAATPINQPKDKVLERFSRITVSLLAKVAENERESRTLAELRDTLLPKLISGELRLKDVERFVGEHA